MNADWIKSPTARRVFEHWADLRPAWLWSGDGQRLLWRNDSARLFGSRIKKGTLRVALDPVPIKGQVARLIRLGVLGRSSLSRVQFLIGEKPVSATCTCTPLLSPDGSTALLIVAVDPVETDLVALSDSAELGPGSAALLPADARHLVVDEDGQVMGASEGALEAIAPLVQAEADGDLPGDPAQTVEIAGERYWLGRFRASAQDATLFVLLPIDGEARSRIDQLRAEDGLDALRDVSDTHPDGPEGESGDEPLLPMGLPAASPAQPRDDIEEPASPPAEGPLSSLFDRLAGETHLDQPPAPDLPETPVAAHDQDAPQAEPAEAPAATAEIVPLPLSAASNETLAAIIAFAEDEANEDPVAPADAGEPPVAAEAAMPEPEDEPQAEETVDTDTRASDEPAPTLYRITGRGFRPRVKEPAKPAAAQETQAVPEPAEAAAAASAGAAPTVTAPVAAEGMDRRSRHNFDELSRILTDRVGAQTQDWVPEATSADALRQPPAQPSPPAGEGALISPNAETFVLNRLPLGIMVFRDQQVLFANRALIELLGHDTVESLRQAGIAAIFPHEDAEAPGPVSRLVRADGTPLPVTARLQSISWQGRSALMLSASASSSDGRFSHEAAVKAFAELAATARREGFLATDRNGVVTIVSAAARSLLGADAEPIGQPLSVLLEDSGRAALRLFLEQPARFAETVRPSVTLPMRKSGVEITLFAEGQAGIVAGYFGFMRAEPRGAEPAEPVADTAMLGRISRGVRRPLNTIIGFAELIRSAAFGEMENQRYLEYARDIRTAGQEIAVLVDELDEFSRLKDGRYPARPSDIDLGALLDSCLVRVRHTAGQRRVLVRSGISERLPHLRADRASLGQAVLNLLASAIAQSPAGSTVILSAQPDDDGSLSIQIRDSSQPATDPGERFVVFRDGTDKDGAPLEPVASSVGLALTRSLLSVNACRLNVAPTPGSGTLFSITVPAELITQP